jgi:uncharacterized protein (DUF1697 family)
MTAYVAMLRAINVGGRKLVMSDLKAIGEEMSLGSPRTFIASGNLIFTSSEAEEPLRERLEHRLSEHMGAEVPVLIRNASEMAAVAAGNPFEGEFEGNRVVAIFLNEPPQQDALSEAKNLKDERVALGKREFYVAYPSGMADSKLRIPAAAKGTARNMNTVSKMAQIAKDME